MASLDRFEEVCDRNLHAHHPRGTPPTLQELANLNIITVPRVIDDFLANDAHQETDILPAVPGLKVLGGQRVPYVNGDERAAQLVEAEGHTHVLAHSDSDGISVQSGNAVDDEERVGQLVDDDDNQQASGAQSESDDSSNSEPGEYSDDDSEVLDEMAEALADEDAQREWDMLEYL